MMKSLLFSVSKMLNPSSPTQKNPSEEDSSGSDAGSGVGLEPETDRFGFIVTNKSTAGWEDLHQCTVLLPFFNTFPSTPVASENAATLFCCEATKMFCGVRKYNFSVSVSRTNTRTNKCSRNATQHRTISVYGHDWLIFIILSCLTEMIFRGGYIQDFSTDKEKSRKDFVCPHNTGFP